VEVVVKAPHLAWEHTRAPELVSIGEGGEERRRGPEGCPIT
jgi:hypothetical protein